MVKLKTLFRLATAGLLLCGAAQAQTVVGVHTISTHFRTGPNNVNLGAFIRFDGWELGDYFNSHRANTLYFGKLWEFPQYEFMGLRPGISIGGATGYKWAITPFALASVSFPIAEKLRGRIEYTKDPRVKSFGVMHLRLEYEF